MPEESKFDAVEYSNFPVDTGRKLNVRSIYVLCLRGYKVWDTNVVT